MRQFKTRIIFNGRSSINKRIICFFLLAFPQLKPNCVSHVWPSIDRFYDIGRLVSLVFIVMLLFIKKKSKFQLTILLIILMEIWITVITYVYNSQSLNSNITYFSSSIAIPVLMYLFSDYMDEVTSALLMIYEWLIYASLISIIIYFPKGMFQSSETGRGLYFLGNENGIIFYVIPAICLSIIHIKKTGKKIRGLLLIAACLANEIVVWCATGIVGLVFACIIVLFSLKKRKNPNYYFVLIITLIADILITVVRAFDRFGLFVFFIDKVLNKTLTFSGRTFIWDAALPVIMKRPLTGCGRGNHIILGYFARHAHNEYFQLLIVGGIPLLLAFVILLIHYGRVFSIIQRRSITVVLMVAMLGCLYVQFITTSRINFELYIPLALASYANEIDSMIEMKSTVLKQ